MLYYKSLGDLCVRAHHLNITSCVSIKGLSWILSGSSPLAIILFIAPAPNFIRMVEFMQEMLIKVKWALLARQKPFGGWKIHAEWSVSIITQPCGSAAAFCCVILVCIVISNGPSFHSSQVSWLFPFPCNLGKPKLLFLVHLHWPPLVFQSFVQL